MIDFACVMITWRIIVILYDGSVFDEKIIYTEAKKSVQASDIYVRMFSYTVG